MSLYMSSSKNAARPLCCDMALKSPDGKGPKKQSQYSDRRTMVQEIEWCPCGHTLASRSTPPCICIISSCRHSTCSSKTERPK